MNDFYLIYNKVNTLVQLGGNKTTIASLNKAPYFQPLKRVDVFKPHGTSASPVKVVKSWTISLIEIIVPAMRAPQMENSTIF